MEPCTALHGLVLAQENTALIGISAFVRSYRCVLKANSHGGCSTARKNVAWAVAQLHANFLAELGSHATQFLEPLSDPLHDLLVRGGFARWQKAIPACELLFAGLLDFLDCRESLHWSTLVWGARKITAFRASGLMVKSQNSPGTFDRTPALRDFSRHTSKSFLRLAILA